MSTMARIAQATHAVAASCAGPWKLFKLPPSISFMLKYGGSSCSPTCAVHPAEVAPRRSPPPAGCHRWPGLRRAFLRQQ